MLILIYLFTQILLIALKVSDVIDWSWGEVLIPSWVMISIFCIMLLFWIVACILFVMAAMAAI